MAEMIPYGEKGRPIGERHGKSRWTDEMVEQWRNLFESGEMRASQICKEYMVPKSSLSEILNYKTRAVTPVSWKPKKRKASDET